jgi:4-hydroxy-tetrahydrodipicolinate synthase
MLRIMAAVQRARPDFTFLTGWEPALWPMLAIGCHGGTCATSGVVPEVTRRLYDVARSGDDASAQSLQFRVTELFDLIMGSGDFPEGFRAAVAMRGFAMGPSRHPGAAPPTHAARIARLIDDLLAESP